MNQVGAPGPPHAGAVLHNRSGDVDLTSSGVRDPPEPSPHVIGLFLCKGRTAGALRANWPGTFGIVGAHVSRGAYRMFAQGFSVPDRLAAVSHDERPGEP